MLTMENLIKDMKLYTRFDKTACTRWQANQFRLFLHMGAYLLLHAMRRCGAIRRAASRKSRWRTATFATIRCVFVKIAARVRELKHGIKPSFPPHLPHADDLGLIVGCIIARGS